MNPMRDRILDAAVEVALKDGIIAMTLDGVCKHVGISKGGLVHHFRSKDILLVEMMERFVDHFEQRLAAMEMADQVPQHRSIRAMLRTAQAMASGKPIHGIQVSSGHAMRLMMSLLTASANNPLLLQTIRTKFDSMRSRMMSNSQPDGHLALVLWMAFDGFMLWQHLGLLPNDTDLGQELIARMLALIDEPVTERPTQGKQNAKKSVIGKCAARPKAVDQRIPKSGKVASARKGKRR